MADLFRKCALRIFQRINPGDITIRHQYTGDQFFLHSFRHKAYWYHGKRREKRSMEIFSEIIRPGDLVIEIGGHIGYLTLYFSSLVGSPGRVVVFEPGVNNLPYLRKNLASRSNVDLIEKAVSDFNGAAKFHLENLSGQNNSLISNCKPFAENLKAAGISSVETSVMRVECTTLDRFFEGENLPVPSFVKIDVEGSEKAVLSGMEKIARKRDMALMVEVTENRAEVYQLLDEYGFRLFDDSRNPIRSPRDIGGNVFCIKESDARVAGFVGWQEAISSSSQVPRPPDHRPSPRRAPEVPISPRGAEWTPKSPQAGQNRESGQAQ